jgi:hypothetical protein
MIRLFHCAVKKLLFCMCCEEAPDLVLNTLMELPAGSSHIEGIPVHTSKLIISHAFLLNSLVFARQCRDNRSLPDGAFGTDPRTGPAVIAFQGDYGLAVLDPDRFDRTHVGAGPAAETSLGLQEGSTIPKGRGHLVKSLDPFPADPFEFFLSGRGFKIIHV